MLKKQNMFFFQKNAKDMPNIIIFGSQPKPNSVHFLPIITIPQVNLYFVCVYSTISHIKNVLVTSIHVTPVNS